jgi:hypothetical protein
LTQDGACEGGRKVAERLCAHRQEPVGGRNKGKKESGGIYLSQAFPVSGKKRGKRKGRKERREEKEKGKRRGREREEKYGRQNEEGGKLKSVWFRFKYGVRKKLIVTEALTA